jgi:predicted DNA-binding antitoxin AbrB/MazE fold protein
VKYQLQWTFAKRLIASIPLVLQLKSILSLLKPMETINVKEEVRSLIDRLPENCTWSDVISTISLRQGMKSEPIQITAIKQGKNIQLSDFLRQVSKSEPIQVKGIKQGKNIQLSENFNIPDGSEVLIEVREVSPVNPEEKLKRMKEFLPALSDEEREELQKISREFLESARTTNRKSSVMPPKKRRAPLFGSDRDLISISDGFDEPLEDFKDYM